MFRQITIATNANQNRRPCGFQLPLLKFAFEWFLLHPRNFPKETCDQNEAITFHLLAEFPGKAHDRCMTGMNTGKHASWQSVAGPSLLVAYCGLQTKPSQAATCGLVHEEKSQQATYYVYFIFFLLLSLLFQVIFVLLSRFLSFSDMHLQIREKIFTGTCIFLLMDIALGRMCETHQFENNHKWQNGDSRTIGSQMKKIRKTERKN